MVATADIVLVAGDETFEGLWAIPPSAPSTHRWLRFPRETPKLDDIEDLARGESPDVFYAVTSLSRTKGRGKLKKSRSRLARITLTPCGERIANVEVFPHNKSNEQSLRDGLLSSLRANIHVSNPKALDLPPPDGGVNVEGAVRWGDDLLLGLREPLTKDGDAIVVPLRAVGALFAESRRLNFGEPLVIPGAGGLGIRSLAENGDHLLVLLGPRSGEAERKFRLLHWNPDTGAARNATEWDISRAIRPEGIAVDTKGNLIVVNDLPEGDPRDAVQILPPHPQATAAA